MSLRTLIDASPRNAQTGAVQAVRLGGGGTAPLYHQDLTGTWQHYRAGVVRSPRFSAKLGFEANGWTGGTLPTTGTIVFAPAERVLLAQHAGLFWKGAAITVRTGPEAGPFSVLMTGTVADASAAAGKLVLTIADLSAGVDKPLLTGRFAGTGGVEGIAEAAGRVKRRSWGRVFNVEGRILDKANNIYEFSDPARPLQAFDALRDKGSAGPIAGLAWQGSVAATFAALQAAAAPAGGGVVAPSIACAKWWTQPTGPLTADLRGEVGGGYVEDVVGLAGRVLASIGGPAIANAAQASAWRSGPAGIHVAEEAETAAQAIDRLLLGASLLWVLDPAGTVTIRQISFANPAETIRPISSTRQRQLAPVKSRRLGYQRNQRQHSEGEIAAVLRGSDVAYSDNTPIDSLRPAEAGANVTESRYAAGFSGEGALARANAASWSTQVSNRPAELTDGRVSSGLASSGGLIGGIQGADGTRFAMAEVFGGIAGTNIAANPEFSGGFSSGYAVYNNSGGSKVTLTVVADAAAPNGSGYVARISYDGTGTPDVNPNPGFGGIFQGLLDGGGVSKPGFYARGTMILYKVIAKIPAGRTLVWQGNAIGAESYVRALTSMAGTGDWQLYVFLVQIGKTGSFSSIGHLNIAGGPNAAFDWYVAKYDQIDISASQRVFMGRTLADEDGVYRGKLDLVTALGNALGFFGEGALARANSALWSTQVSGAGKPEDYATYDGVVDDRPNARLPSYYRANFPMKVRREFQHGSYIAIPGQDGTSVYYGILETIVDYPNDSGGPVRQRFVTSAGQIWTRNGAADDSAWNGWQRSYGEQYKPIFGADLREDANTIATLAAFKTLLGYAAGFQGEGALARKNAVDWNSAGDILNKPVMNGSGGTLTYTGLPSNYIELVVAPGETVGLDASVNMNSSIGATRQFRVEIAPAGGAFSTVVDSPSGTLGTSSTEPFTDQFVASWTNNTGVKQAFRFRAGASNTTGLAVAQQAQCYLSVS